jgi:uncharacterized protein DUF1353
MQMRSRRDFLAAATAICLGVGRGVCAEKESGKETYADVAAADDWMKKWMDNLGAVAEPLNVGRFADPMYYLIKPIGWKPGSGQNAHEVRVPIGFVTDFASIPRIFWSVLRPDGLYTYPAIIHDFLYWEQTVSRSEADAVLRYVMEDFKIDTATIDTIYLAVRSGGGFAWDKNATLKASGERRVFKCFPTDPTVRWADWKGKPGVC